MSKTLDYIALIVVFIGAVNWGLIGLFRLDLVRLIFGDMTWISRRRSLYSYEVGFKSPRP